MIDSRTNRFSLELLHNYKVNRIPENMVFSSIYQQIVDISRNAPLYLIYPSDELQTYATQIKELSLQLGDMLKCYFRNDASNPLRQLQLVAPPSEYVSVKPLKPADKPAAYSVEINSVAAGQINRGNSVSRKICPFTAQIYSFRIESEDESFDFELPITNDSTNETVLHQIQNLIRQTTNHLDSWIEEDDSKIALHLQAQANRQNKPASFTIKDTTHNGIVSFYGLDRIYALPQPSVFSVNDEPFHSYGITFEIDELFELTLNTVCQEPVHISFEMDTSKITEEIKHLADTINHLIILSNSCPNSTLKCELTSFLLSHKEALASVGIDLSDANTLQTDPEKLELSIQDSSLETLLSKEESFSKELMEHTKEISIDPMKYVPNKVVSYKNFTSVNYPNPYLTSMYSGFLFTNCC